MRARRRDRQLLIAALVTIVGVWLLAAADRVEAAVRVAPSCWWDGTTLHAINLPDLWAVTRHPFPIGVTQTADSFAVDFSGEPSFTAYIWTRGGPYTALFKPGRQLNDYKPVAVCVP